MLNEEVASKLSFTCKINFLVTSLVKTIAFMKFVSRNGESEFS